MASEICPILLIDDDEDDYLLTRDFLSESEQLEFKLDWSSNYRDGLAKIAENRHAAYLLDYRLGKENGLELMQEAISRGCNKPIILLTGVGDSQVDRQAMSAGASDYLIKGKFLNPLLLERSILHAIERKRHELQQQQLMQELASVNQELKDFAHIVSHDLKAPLRGIASLSDWIIEDYADRLDEEGKKVLGLIGGRVRRMGELIDGVLQYSRIGRLREEKISIDLHQVVLGVIEFITPPAGIKIQIDRQLPQILADTTRIQQLFQNLIGNAIKYMGKSEGEIHIGYYETRGFWEFYVSDTGIGIEAKYFNRIFQIFQALNPSDQPESTGVGLAIAKKIVEIYGGHIWVTSKIMQGSTFYFTLPICRNDEPSLSKADKHENL
ncbi:hybrid sensor histidine kinase/response regulator [Pseudanabaena sp. UWO310]|uniref:hybrid sensor histidine kinase/response regulator n=1 Tax=Pseudanabaena sp. UWO310 TaxID=2480795 RepID=UPI00115AF8D0|nr:hybrid sensor histidine kinase/response regulator [Pseudanabaena sp. UWO310]TYQ31604.1 response regulator [Pseudanabaena sp. UWO310]